MKVLNFILKNWRWELFLICVIAGAFLPHKPVLPFISGLAAGGFLILGYVCYDYYLNKP